VDYLVNNPPLPKEVCLVSNSPKDNNQHLPEAYLANNLPLLVVFLANSPNKNKQHLQLKQAAYSEHSHPKVVVLSELN
jgi:hypothetical protein